MPVPRKFTPEQVRDAVLAEGTIAGAARRLNTCRNIIKDRLAQLPEAERPKVGQWATKPQAAPEKPRYRVRADGTSEHISGPKLPELERVDLAALLRKAPLSLDEISARINGDATAALDELERKGFNIRSADGRVSIETVVEPAFTGGAVFEYVSRTDNTFLFGATGDNHMGSKYARQDVLDALYHRFAEAGVDRVFNTGNWIEGEAKFNKFDINVYGMDRQCRHLAEHYPHKAGIVTYAVAGDDHEGWYAQREGINIGRYAENAMRDAGRTDWVHLGYMEAHIKLVNANSGKSSILAVVHPGGGSAYALSYAIQKIVESLEGGEKPAVGLYGHYHKLWAGNIRNVWVAQTGTTKDQDPFMRKKRLEAHVGGALIGLEQDPRTGAITAMTPKLMRYFNRGYYENRWSHSGDVTLPDRGVAV